MRLVIFLFFFNPFSGNPTTWEVYLTTKATYPVAAPWDHTSIDGHWLAEERNKNQFTATQQKSLPLSPTCTYHALSNIVGGDAHTRRDKNNRVTQCRGRGGTWRITCNAIIIFRGSSTPRKRGQQKDSRCVYRLDFRGLFRLLPMRK